MKQLVVSAALYGAFAFVAGFVFGTLREFVFIPVFGRRDGALLELPLLMITVLFLSEWLIRGPQRGASAVRLLAVGVLGAAVLVVIEGSFTLLVMQRSWNDYLAGFDVTAGALFPIGLAGLALAPAIVGRVRESESTAGTR